MRKTSKYKYLANVEQLVHITNNTSAKNGAIALKLKQSRDS